jgi:hypothetical protein
MIPGTCHIPLLLSCPTTMSIFSISVILPWLPTPALPISYQHKGPVDCTYNTFRENTETTVWVANGHLNTRLWTAILLPLSVSDSKMTAGTDAASGIPKGILCDLAPCVPAPFTTKHHWCQFSLTFSPKSVFQRTPQVRFAGYVGLCLLFLQVVFLGAKWQN